MNISARAAAITSALAFSIAVAACGKKDQGQVVDTTAAGTQTATVSVDTTPIKVSDIQIGKSIGADKKVSNGTTTFAVRDTMYAAVVTDGAAKDAKLTGKWTFGNGQVVKQETQTISPTGGEYVTEFHITKASAWPKGAYKFEAVLNGVSAGTKDLEVK
jgi:hypothetical protein